jgi:hypothetical protein
MTQLIEALWSMPVQAATDMVRTAQPFMQQLMSEELTLPPPIMAPGEEEEPPDDPPEQPRAKSTAHGQAQPSPNGVRRPMGAVPRWLLKIAEHARMATIRPTPQRLDSG